MSVAPVTVTVLIAKKMRNIYPFFTADKRKSCNISLPVIHCKHS